jgi:Tn3 transposase DDE domain/Domain of unknown function (DUF4158)
MATKSKRLTLLSDAEQFAPYGLPDFDDGQQLEYLSLSEAELALACSRPGLHAQVYCVLQIGYFKANIDQIIATLDLKEMTQGTLIRKLCTFTTSNPTRRAILEFDKLIRSLYTLRYLLRCAAPSLRQHCC